MEVKFPFTVEVPFDVPEPELTHVPIEEFNKVKLTITEMKDEEGRQQAILTRVARERDDLMQILKERDDELLKSQEQVERERKAKFRVKDNLDVFALKGDALEDANVNSDSSGSKRFTLLICL